MNCRRLISSVIGIVYLLTTQLVVHAVAMHNMSHDTISYHSRHDDHHTYHTQEDLGIGEPATQHDSSSCITIAKTASKTHNIQLIDHVAVDSIRYQSAHSTYRLPDHSIITVADYQPPGWSSFLDNHYGHGVVMIS